MRKYPDKYVLLIVACLALAAWLRCSGLTRRTSDFIPPAESSAGAVEVVYKFHPDEETLVGAALSLDDPLQPPLTAYGTLPMYALRCVLELVSWIAGKEELSVHSATDRPLIFRAARLTAAALSWLSVVLVWWIGWRFFNRPTALLAAYCTAVAPVAVQQAHFYTVDGVFAFCTLVFFCVALQAIAHSQSGLYIAAGALVGAAAVRLNGLLLGAVLVCGHVFRSREVGEGAWRTLRRSEIWLAGAAALLVLVALQPFLIFEPELLGRNQGTDDFAYSVKVASGEFLRSWSLVDVHTLPYLHYWTHLWPLAVGWPLTLAFGAALVYGACSRHWVVRMALVWVVLAFLSIGGLHTKHVRYLLPLLPFLSLAAADMFWRWARHRPRLMGAGLALILIYSGVYGIAFARIYTAEDSRIRAGRWMAENAPPSTVIGVENGGFSLREMIDRERHREHVLPTSTLFGVRGYLLCESTRLYLQKQLRAVDYIAITDVNRYRQFVAVPELYPAVAGFYEKLVADELGFSQERRFKIYPSLLGWDFRDDGAEPSFLGYDHPTVWILRRTDDFERAWEAWGRELVESPRCGDARARKVAAHVEAGAWAQALDELEGARQVHPDLRFLAFVEAHIHGLRGDVQSQRRARDQYLQGLADQALTAALLPWATSLSLMELGLFDLSLQALETSTRIVFPDHYKHRMADRCLDIAELFLARNDRIRAAAAYRQSMEIEPRAEVAHILGDMAYESGRADEAREWWERALELDPQQLALHKRKGRDAYERGHRALGLEYLGLAVQFDPRLTREQKKRDFNALAEMALQSALVDQARIFWRHSLELDRAQVEVKRRLQRLGADDGDR